MKTYALCPCCSNKLMHHISRHRDYWFCRGCWQEMPLINIEIIEEETHNFNNERKINVKAIANLVKPTKVSLTIG